LQFAGLRHSRTCRGSQISRWRLLDQYSSVKGLKSQKRSRAEEAVAAQPLATDHALKKKRPVAFLDFAKSADRRQGVAAQLSIHRHQAMVLGQSHEFVKGGAVAHA